MKTNNSPEKTIKISPYIMTPTISTQNVFGDYFKSIHWSFICYYSYSTSSAKSKRLTQVFYCLPKVLNVLLPQHRNHLHEHFCHCCPLHVGFTNQLSPSHGSISSPHLLICHLSHCSMSHRSICSSGLLQEKQSNEAMDAERSHKWICCQVSADNVLQTDVSLNLRFCSTIWLSF